MSAERLLTARFIDPDFSEWYNKALPGHVAEQFPDGLELPEYVDELGDDLPNFEEHLTQSLVAVHEPRNAYHGWTHGARYTENTAEGYDAMGKRCGLFVPPGFLQPALVGSARHDQGHTGSTFFSDANPDRLPPGASIDQTAESYAAEQSSRAVAAAGGTLAQQVLAAYIPISTTYGAHEVRGRELGIARATNPKGIGGILARAVDVVPAAGDFAASVTEDQGVLYGEKRPEGNLAPMTFERYCKERIGFLSGYVLPTFDKLDAAVESDLTGYLGWRQRAHTRLAQTEAMLRGDSAVLRSIALSHLKARYGITLPLR